MSAAPKLLFLQGFLQNAKVFSEKSSGIRKLLKKANIQCDYLDAPVMLEKKDLPFVMDDEKWQATLDADVNRAWFYHSEISHELDLSEAIAYVVKYIKENGPYDGIVGFSQGAALSSILTNKITTLLPEHPEFKLSLIISGYCTEFCMYVILVSASTGFPFLDCTSVYKRWCVCFKGLLRLAIYSKFN